MAWKKERALSGTWPCYLLFFVVFVGVVAVRSVDMFTWILVDTINMRSRPGGRLVFCTVGVFVSYSTERAQADGMVSGNSLHVGIRIHERICLFL